MGPRVRLFALDARGACLPLWCGASFLQDVLLTIVWKGFLWDLRPLARIHCEQYKRDCLLLSKELNRSSGESDLMWSSWISIWGPSISRLLPKHSGFPKALAALGAPRMYFPPSPDVEWFRQYWKTFGARLRMSSTWGNAWSWSPKP